MNKITFHPQAVIEAGLIRADALISIVGTTDKQADINTYLFGDQVLRLVFDDVPWSTAWHSPKHDEVFTGATENQVAQALAFGAALHTQECRSLAVHCRQGKSRSTAIVLAILTDRCRDPGQAVDVLLDSATWPINPNPGIVRHAEQLLGMSGKLNAALFSQCPEYRSWLAYWENKGWRYDLP